MPPHTILPPRRLSDLDLGTPDLTVLSRLSINFRSVCFRSVIFTFAHSQGWVNKSAHLTLLQSLLRRSDHQFETDKRVWNEKNLDIIHAVVPTNVKLLKLYCLHTFCHNFDTFRSIFIICRELLRINKAYMKTRIDSSLNTGVLISP
jgi:hypothetical protein